jgi:hypothetical protein
MTDWLHHDGLHGRLAAEAAADPTAQPFCNVQIDQGSITTMLSGRGGQVLHCCWLLAWRPFKAVPALVFCSAVLLVDQLRGRFV